MAASPSSVHPARNIAVFALLLICAYLLVFLTGNKIPEPKLGIDLQGGTRVTLTARTPDGSAPTRQALEQAQKIINARVNGLGVSGSEVIIDGNNLVITVPGTDGNEARLLGQTAKLSIRPVIYSLAVGGDNVLPPPGMPPGKQLRLPGAPGAPGEIPGAPGNIPPGGPGGPEGPPAPASAQDNPQEGPNQAPPEAQPRPYPRQPSDNTDESSPQQEASQSESDHPSLEGSPSHESPSATKSTLPTDKPLTPEEAVAARVKFNKRIRQSTQRSMQALALQILQKAGCKNDDGLGGEDDPDLPLVTCSQDRQMVYLLAPSIISGDEIDDASSGIDQRNGGYIVQVKFNPATAQRWGEYTANHIGTQTAFTLDSQVVSAPVIQEAIPGGNMQISGGNPPFSAATARQLANVLKYGSLPLSFESSQAETVSAGLGMSSLHAGLIAGAIGLGLVLIYALLYYRIFGFITALSLVASGTMIYAILILLGRYINYTLDLAGIAGLIIGIGTTADSFVVFFERIKDEIREGRSFRSAVPRGWTRARKTIISGNAVTFLAAIVLYTLAIGQVKGFAFTLGLTTLLDLVVVILITWPLVNLASRSKTLAQPKFNGLGAVQQIARERYAVKQMALSSAGQE